MSEDEFAVQRFEAHRAHLRAVAHRMLGTASEADDAVQETWIRFARTDTGDVANLRGWLTTVVSRVCLNLLETRKTRRETPIEFHGAGASEDADPEREAMLSDSVGLALLVVLDSLGPAERLAFVLHDLFGVPYERIGPIVERTPEAARQLASRARRRVRGTAPVPDLGRQREVVDAFLDASRNGDFERLLTVLDPEIVVRADDAAVKAGAEREVSGVRAVAETFLGRARGAEVALVGDRIGALWSRGGKPRIAFRFTIVDGRVAAIDIVAEPDGLQALSPVVLEP
ncbi:sigma-70 family RNA polymerase sigma factor [Glycomyces buryatensis]|uniref:Sigma-70 family RNA polymerase sigma factor n=1 Tax=Glycomyces buryatensis TaxID=2570927 RepID=A0A4S8PPP1_9ACTN|nr:sigma-70 family RNA polymerase sigma factor [Glycomyces buryatensis]THV32897.1 sigma-70 family RNA polymerase sigma factor [Glycomyces buryatensis]